MRNMTESDLTGVVLARYAGTPDPACGRSCSP